MTQGRDTSRTESFVLVVGATGLLGTAICERLRERGLAVRALVRPGSRNAEQLAARGCSLAIGDLKNPASLRAACRGVHTVVTTANAMMSRGHGDSLRAVDRDGTLALMRAAAEAGVQHFVYTSVSPLLPANNPFVRWKRECEAALRVTGMAWTILQPSAFMEIHAGPVGGWDFARGRVRLVGPGRVPIGYVSLRDVAAFTAAAVTNPAGRNRVLHITGPESLSAMDAVRIAERVTGQPFTVQRVPAAVIRALGVASQPFSDRWSSLFKGLSLTTPEAADTAPLASEFGVELTTFEQYVQRALSSS